MATGLIFNDAKVRLSTTTCQSIDSTNNFDLTPFVQSVRITGDSDNRDNTVMGMSYRSNLRALKTAIVECRLLNQFSVAAEPCWRDGATSGEMSIDALLFSTYSATDKSIIMVRPDNTVRSSCNPDYWMPCSLGTHIPMDGAVADLLVTNLRFESQGDLTRQTSSS